MDTDIRVRQIKTRDFDKIREICYRTGYMGQDLSDLDMFSDEKLFSLLFCDFYLLYQRSNCFVAVDATDQPIGYIIGSQDTRLQEQQFIKYMFPKIIAHVVLHTIWKDAHSARQLVNFLEFTLKNNNNRLYNTYPAHFHINIRPGFQGKGIGSLLMERFETHLKEHGIEGVHLSTTSANKGAIGFYKKLNYSIQKDIPYNIWGIEDVRSIIMAKELCINSF